jgi:hypothetical protein
MPAPQVVFNIYWSFLDQKDISDQLGRIYQELLLFI